MERDASYGAEASGEVSARCSSSAAPSAAPSWPPSDPRHAADPGQSFDGHAEFYRHSLYGQFDQQHRSGGSLDANMLRVRQDPIDMIDAPVPDYVFLNGRGSLPRVRIDMGDGPAVLDELADDTLQVIPPHTAARFAIDRPHEVRALSLPAARLDPLLAEHGLTASAFAANLPTSDYAIDRARDRPLVRLMDAIWRTAGPDQENGTGKGAGAGRGLIAPEADGVPATGPDDLLLDGLVLQFIALAATAGGTDRGAVRAFAAAPVPALDLSDARLVRAVDHLEAHLGDALSVGALASVAGLSPSQFARAFRTASGETVWAFVQRRRTERAVELLATTALSQAEIAHQCGFASHAHMARNVRLRFGTTPGSIQRS